MGRRCSVVTAAVSCCRGDFGIWAGHHHPQRLAVIAPQDVVDEAHALGVRHPGDLKLPISGLVQGPPGLVEQQVDEQVPGLDLVVVVVIRDVCLARLRRRNLGTQVHELGVAGGRHRLGRFGASMGRGQLFIARGDLLAKGL